MKKMIALIIATVGLIPICATAQRRTREAPPVYTHVPCSTPGAKQERPIDLSAQPNAAADKIERSAESETKNAAKADRITCVIEGPPRRR